MSGRPITPWKPGAELFGDEFRQRASYTNWRPHGTGDWLLIYTEAGAGRFVSSAGSYVATPGDAVLYAPNEPHDYSTSPKSGKWRLLWVHFLPKPHWHPWLCWPKAPNGIRLLRTEPGEVRKHFTAAMRRLIAMSHRELPGALDLAANALEEALLWAHVAASNDRWFTMDPRVRRAIDYLTTNSREPISLTDLARHCGASVSRLASLFKKETGKSPQQFMERHRMQHASQLVRLTSLSISEIAGEVGYQDPFYFSNRFRRFAGQSPLQYRRQQASQVRAKK